MIFLLIACSRSLVGSSFWKVSMISVCFIFLFSSAFSLRSNSSVMECAVFMYSYDASVLVTTEELEMKSVGTLRSLSLGMKSHVCHPKPRTS